MSAMMISELDAALVQARKAIESAIDDFQKKAGRCAILGVTVAWIDASTMAERIYVPAVTVELRLENSR